MGIFRQFPYSNFHDMNMDELIKIVRQLADDWLEYQTKWANLYDDVSTAFEAFERDFNDFLNGAQTEFTEFMTAKNSEFTAFMNNIDVAVELRAALNTMVADGTFNTIVRTELTPAIEAWLNSHITEPTGVVIDTSLSVAGTCADAKAAGDAIRKNAKQLTENNAFNVIQDMHGSDNITSGISFSWNEDKCTVYGTATAMAINNMFASNTAIPEGFKKGSKYYVDFESEAVEFQVLQMSSTGSIVTYLFGSKTSGWFTIPANISGMIIRMIVRSGSNANETVQAKITEFYSNEQLQNMLETDTAIYKGSLPLNTDLNTVTTGIWLLASNRNYVNSPILNQRYGTMLSFIEDNVTCQIVYDAVLKRCLIRHAINNNFENWADVADPYIGALVAGTDLNTVGSGVWLMATSRNYQNTPIADTQYGTLICYKEDNVTFQICYAGGGDNGKSYVRSWINDDYRNWQSATGGGTQVFNEYHNTYNVSASPRITTDTNSYLAPTGDTTNVTADIITLLTSTGVCRLGKGNYYVENLVMPANTALIGAGAGTNIILIDGDEKFAVAPKSGCIVKDLTIMGSLENVEPISTVRDRHGVLWQGTYTEDQNSPEKAILENLYIKNFAGGGITCYDTGYGTFSNIETCNLYIWNCDAGINISYWSEYHKFTNVRAYNCYYGCINNGGNNSFVNCDFSGNDMAFLMDNGLNQSPNNSHGMCIGCLFNHTGGNAGTGIKILNCDNGFIFSGCQIFFSKLDIEDSDGVLFSDNNFGQSNCDIIIKNGGAVIFNSNIHQGTPTITITNNNKVHFNNCYNRSTGELITP